ncbi:uncharacterized protein LOC141852985 [Brevipalpus obovatus]|uniref:uncharacterized protein LOC141852985 n=1 Tax=Brevipalpus obovatus TaxID=246614 RepID=UPI003D9F1D05
MSTCCASNLTHVQSISVKISPFDHAISTIYNSEYDSRSSSQDEGESVKSSHECQHEINQRNDSGSDILSSYQQYKSHQDAFPLISSLKYNFSSPIKRKEIKLQKIRDNQCCLSWRDLINRVMDHFVFRMIIIWLIMIDSILIIFDISSPSMAHQDRQYFDMISLAFSIIFFVEILLRIFSIGKHQFFSDWFSWIDFMIIVLSLPINIVCMVSHLARLERLIIIVRLVPIARLVEIIREIMSEFKSHSNNR